MTIEGSDVVFVKKFRTGADFGRLGPWIGIPMVSADLPLLDYVQFNDAVTPDNLTSINSYVVQSGVTVDVNGWPRAADGVSLNMQSPGFQIGINEPYLERGSPFGGTRLEWVGGKAQTPTTANAELWQGIGTAARETFTNFFSAPYWNLERWGGAAFSLKHLGIFPVNWWVAWGLRALNEVS